MERSWECIYLGFTLRIWFMKLPMQLLWEHLSRYEIVYHVLRTFTISPTKSYEYPADVYIGHQICCACASNPVWGLGRTFQVCHSKWIYFSSFQICRVWLHCVNRLFLLHKQYSLIWSFFRSVNMRMLLWKLNLLLFNTSLINSLKVFVVDNFKSMVWRVIMLYAIHHESLHNLEDQWYSGVETDIL